LVFLVGWVSIGRKMFHGICLEEIIEIKYVGQCFGGFLCLHGRHWKKKILMAVLGRNNTEENVLHVVLEASFSLLKSHWR
jgi:hypothetical protein